MKGGVTVYDMQDRKQAAALVAQWTQAKQRYHEAAMGPQGRGRTCSDAEIATLVAAQTAAEAALLALGTRLLERNKGK